MKATRMKMLTGIALSAAVLSPLGVQAEEGLDKLYGDFRLRLETVDQDNALKACDSTHIA